MRIHTDKIVYSELFDAAHEARATIVRSTTHGSRKRDHAFDVALVGESRRRPNFYDGSGDYAATWDQWGVFIARLFELDQDAIVGTYVGAEDFAFKTYDRFGAPEVVVGDEGYYEVFKASGWPEDAHGDHTFRYVGPRTHKCTKCSAVQRWAV